MPDFARERTKTMEILCPSRVLSSVLDIDLQALWNQGIRGLILDLDNTLVCWDKSVMEDRFREWIKEAKRHGFKVCIVSNGLTKRVNQFALSMGIPAIAKAQKPRKRAFRWGLRALELAPENVAVIGDQLFTDVFGGNRLGLYTILIDPLSKQELRTTKFVRKIERWVLKKLVEKGLLCSQTLKDRYL
jgi:HAD superfamily phosphatase (TIGR01668 family)